MAHSIGGDLGRTWPETIFPRCSCVSVVFLPSDRCPPNSVLYDAGALHIERQAANISGRRATSATNWQSRLAGFSCVAACRASTGLVPPAGRPTPGVFVFPSGGSVCTPAVRVVARCRVRRPDRTRPVVPRKSRNLLVFACASPPMGRSWTPEARHLGFSAGG